MAKIRALFEAYDANGDAQLDVREVMVGLVSCGVLINERQSKALIKQLDQNKDGEVSFPELLAMLGKVRRKRDEAKVDKKEADALRVLDHIQPGMAEHVSGIRRSIRQSGTGGTFDGANLSSFDVAGGGGTGTGLYGSGMDDNERSLEDVVEMCVERLANRMVLESARLAKKATDGEGKAPVSESCENPQVVLSSNDLDLSKTLKRVLKHRVDDEFKHLLGVSGGNQQEAQSSEERNKQALQGLMSRTIEITREGAGQSAVQHTQPVSTATREEEIDVAAPLTKSEVPTRTNVNPPMAASQSFEDFQEYSSPRGGLPNTPRGDALPWSAQLAKVTNNGAPEPALGAELAGFWGTAHNGSITALGDNSDHFLQNEDLHEHLFGLSPTSVGSREKRSTIQQFSVGKNKKKGQSSAGDAFQDGTVQQDYDSRFDQEVKSELRSRSPVSNRFHSRAPANIRRPSSKRNPSPTHHTIELRSLTPPPPSSKKSLAPVTRRSWNPENNTAPSVLSRSPTTATKSSSKQGFSKVPFAALSQDQGRRGASMPRTGPTAGSSNNGSFDGVTNGLQLSSKSPRSPNNARHPLAAMTPPTAGRYSVTGKGPPGQAL